MNTPATPDRDAPAVRFAAVGTALWTLMRLAATAPTAAVQLEAVRLILEFDARRRKQDEHDRDANGGFVELTELNLKLAVDAARLCESAGVM